MSFSCLLIGNSPLLKLIAPALAKRGHQIAGVVTDEADLAGWAKGQSLPCSSTEGDWAQDDVDWIFAMDASGIQGADLTFARKGAVAWHDGPLPDMAGDLAQTFALLEGQTQHFCTWHFIGAGWYDGDIAVQTRIAVQPADTARTMAAKCAEAALTGFGTLINQIEAGALTPMGQNLARRRMCTAAALPSGLLNLGLPSAEILRMTSALEAVEGMAVKPRAKMLIEDQLVLVGTARLVDGSDMAGTVLHSAEGTVTVATVDGAIRFDGLTLPDGTMAPALETGQKLPLLGFETVSQADALLSKLRAFEDDWAKAFAWFEPANLPDTRPFDTGLVTFNLTVPEGVDVEQMVGRWAASCAQSQPCDLAFVTPDLTEAAASGLVLPWSPLRVDTVMEDASARFTAARSQIGAPLDLFERQAKLNWPDQPHIGVSDGTGPIRGCAITIDLVNGPVMHVDTALVDPEFAELLARRFDHLCATESLLLPEAERDLVLHKWNDVIADYDKADVMHRAFEAQVVRTPNDIALIFENERLTYAELNARANQTAHVLREMGVGPDQIIGLCTKRSVDLLVGALAILKAGGAYLPMDPAYPADRLAHFARDSQAPVIVTQSALAPNLPEHDAQVLLIDTDPRIDAASTENLPDTSKPEHLAYLIYTSGSTGLPKGVMIEHRNVINFYVGMDDRVPHDPAGTWIAVTSLSFDISVLELFYTTARGFCVVLTSDESRTLISAGPIPGLTEDDASLPTPEDDDFSIAAQILRHGVTHLQCTPSMARMIALNDEARLALRRVKHIMLGGEPMPGALVAEYESITSASMENMYGPTETTIWSSTQKGSSSENVVNIGLPLPNQQLYVLDDSQEPVGIGVPGELWIGGDGVTRGYWNRAETTAERFVPNPFHPGRMYRTGDLVRRRMDGCIDFIGRVDFQVKLRGYRIELGEIESEIEKADGVTQAVVMAREDTPGDMRLVGYFTADRAIDLAALRSDMGEALPSFMIPNHLIELDSFPLTPNKKVDRNALPAPSHADVAVQAALSLTGLDAKAKIATLWAHHLSGAGLARGFAEAGGTALTAVLLAQDLTKALDLPHLSADAAFRFTNGHRFAEYLLELRAPLSVASRATQPTVQAPDRAAIMARRQSMWTGAAT